VTGHFDDELVGILALATGNAVTANSIESALYHGDATSGRRLRDALRGRAPQPLIVH
jgi:hypothetical protein